MAIEKTFAALSDPRRFKMVMFLGEKPATVEELRSKLEISQSSTSQHLKILSNVGLVSFAKHGNFRIYSLKKEELKRVMHFFDHLWDEGLAKLKMNLESSNE